MTTMNDAIIQLLGRWPCCTLATVAVSGLPQRERSFFVSFMPEARTAIALGHHVTTEEEWAWYATMDGSEHCAADDHCLEVCQAVKAVLIQFGHDAKIVSYPGRSGLQFRYVAQSAGLGDIGTNAFLFHPQWGPWIHLRVMATTVELDFCTQISGICLCNQCGLCISECPAGAISDGGFNGLQCREYRKARGEYHPYGPSAELRYCKRCILICPQGDHPIPRRRKQQSVR